MRKRLVQSWIVPYFLYCDVIQSHAFAGVNRQLIVAFNSCARYIYGVSRFESISSHSCRILGVSLNDYFDLRINMMTYRLLQKYSPSYLFDRFQRARSTRTMNLIVPRYNTTHRSSSFFVRGVSNWNAVPPVIKMEPSLAAFRDSNLSHVGRTAN
jgi:hypothetical protein